MPTLGFLKKKRTKDLSDPKDLTSPTSPIKDSPSTPTFSSGPTAASASSRASTAESHDSSSKKNEGPTPTTAPQTQALPIQTVSSAVKDAPVDQLTSQPQQKDASDTKADPSKDHPDWATLSEMDGATSTTKEAQPAAKAAQPAQPAATVPVIPRVTKGKYLLTDFTIQRTLGTGSFGRVHLVQSKHNQRFYAVKVLKKQQVVKMKQVEHTNDERRMLQKVKHPFLITLWGTFQDSKNLYMVMDFVEGGELFSLLRNSQVSQGMSLSERSAQSLNSGFPIL